MKHGCRPSSSLRTYPSAIHAVIIFRNISGYIQRRQETGHLAPHCLCRLAIGCQGNGTLKGRLCSRKVCWGNIFHLEASLTWNTLSHLLSIFTNVLDGCFDSFTSPMCAYMCMTMSMLRNILLFYINIL